MTTFAFGLAGQAQANKRAVYEWVNISDDQVYHCIILLQLAPSTLIKMFVMGKPVRLIFISKLLQFLLEISTSCGR